MSIYNEKLSYYVYAYLRKKDFTPYYIGKGKNDRAWKRHRNVTTPKNKCSIVILEHNLTEIGALALERFYIRWYGKKIDNTGILHNKIDGGDGVSGPKTQQHKEKLRLCMIGNIPWNKGKTWNSQIREKISKTLTGKKQSEETKQKRASKHKGMKRSSETKKRISESLKIKVICPHCHKIGGKGAMLRWHFNNCGEKKCL